MSGDQDRISGGASYQHAEAFCLMTYASADGAVREVIWNSRDGVTPFFLSSRDGVEMRHVDWRWDVRKPDHKPTPGDRIFVDLTPERHIELARKRAQRFFEDPQYAGMAHETFGTVERATEVLAGDFKHGSPDLIEVTA